MSLTLPRPTLEGTVSVGDEPEPAAAALLARRVMAAAAWHSLLWLVVANAIGVLLAAMLLVPAIDTVLGEWTYGRWMPVHIDLQLYGWCSLPLVAFLFRVYRADRGPAAPWSRALLWVWTTALAVSAVSWLNGHSSGKLFLDWTGYPRVLFPMALLALWLLLAWASLAHDGRKPGPSLFQHVAKVTGLLLLFAVPPLLYIAADPTIYPPINPDTGGPTGASQLESTLVILAILLSLPFGLTGRSGFRKSVVNVAWWVFAAECVLCLGLGRADVSHHRPVQWVSLGSLLVWIPLIPAYYHAFRWHPHTRRWRQAFLCWWAILVPTGWMLFLPGVLDYVKFTDGLVGHSLLAMGGFVSSLLIFVMVQLLGDDGWILSSPRTFVIWQGSLVAYVALMFFAGWQEGRAPVFAMLPGTLRNSIYGSRLLMGALILLASLNWFLDARSLMRELRSLAAEEARAVPA